MTASDTTQTGSITGAAGDLAAEIAQRLADPARFRHGTGRARRQSLGGGAAGIALLHIERARTGHGDWETAYAWLREAAREPLSAGVNAGLFYGAPAFALALDSAADGADFSGFLFRLDRSVAAVIRQRLQQARARSRSGLAPPMGEFDLIRGLAGLGSYYLRRHPEHDLTVEILDYLVRLTEPLPGREDLPGWWTNTAPTKETAGTARFADGHANLSMSHGIAAALAVLAFALRQGVRVRDHEPRSSGSAPGTTPGNSTTQRVPGGPASSPSPKSADTNRSHHGNERPGATAHPASPERSSSPPSPPATTNGARRRRQPF